MEVLDKQTSAGTEFEVILDKQTSAGTKLGAVPVRQTSAGTELGVIVDKEASAELFLPSVYQPVHHSGQSLRCGPLIAPRRYLCAVPDGNALSEQVGSHNAAVLMNGI